MMKAECCICLSSCLGNSLITLTLHLLNQYGLVELFQLDMVKLWRFLVMVQEDYHSDNPYHNAVHAADVTQAMYCYLREPMVRRGFLVMYNKICRWIFKLRLHNPANLYIVVYNQQHTYVCESCVFLCPRCERSSPSR